MTNKREKSRGTGPVRPRYDRREEVQLVAAIARRDVVYVQLPERSNTSGPDTQQALPPLTTLIRKPRTESVAGTADITKRPRRIDP